MFSDNTDDRDSYRLSTRVAANDTETLTVTAPDPATVEHLRVRFYQGPRLDVEVRPFVEVDGAAGVERYDLVNYADEPEAKEYVDGDDDEWPFSVSKPIDENDVIGVEIQNTNPEHSYDVTVDVEVDFEGGLSRPFAGVVDRIRGVLT
ncbi:hypothetical protein [Halosegnis longus]|uniref:Uncharacterized protein n=1 Tax=Halosegnis longus TaxID=2216012 RepID=A0AAJ4R7B2_9EURY|nr:hypothetical protein Nmn1133_01370 [Salella cibi]